MHPQLKQVEDEIQEARARLGELAEVPEERWSRRPAPESWSAAECVHHLNLTSAAILPGLRDAVERARETGGGAPARFRRGLFGWMIWRASRPSTRMRSKTGASFVPPADLPPRGELVAEFERWQEETLALLRAADGLPLHRERVRSPFGPVSYNAFAAFSILAVHQLRHLAQAQRAAG